jgi:hypothetical protein
MKLGFRPQGRVALVKESSGHRGGVVLHVIKECGGEKGERVGARFGAHRWKGS